MNIDELNELELFNKEWKLTKKGNQLILNKVFYIHGKAVWVPDLIYEGAGDHQLPPSFIQRIINH